MGEELDTFKVFIEKFATMPSSIIYIGVVVILAISEWKNPTEIIGLIYKAILLVTVFVFVTIGNTQYFKWYWRTYNKK